MALNQRRLLEKILDNLQIANPLPIDESIQKLNEQSIPSDAVLNIPGSPTKLPITVGENISTQNTGQQSIVNPQLDILGIKVTPIGEPVPDEVLQIAGTPINNTATNNSNTQDTAKIGTEVDTKTEIDTESRWDKIKNAGKNLLQPLGKITSTLPEIDFGAINMGLMNTAISLLPDPNQERNNKIRRGQHRYKAVNDWARLNDPRWGSTMLAEAGATISEEEYRRRNLISNVPNNPPSGVENTRPYPQQLEKPIPIYTDATKRDAVNRAIKEQGVNAKFVWNGRTYRVGNPNYAEKKYVDYTNNNTPKTTIPDFHSIPITPNRNLKQEVQKTLYEQGLGGRFIWQNKNYKIGDPTLLKNKTQPEMYTRNIITKHNLFRNNIFPQRIIKAEPGVTLSPEGVPITVDPNAGTSWANPEVPVAPVLMEEVAPNPNIGAPDAPVIVEKTVVVQPEKSRVYTDKKFSDAFRKALKDWGQGETFEWRGKNYLIKLADNNTNRTTGRPQNRVSKPSTTSKPQSTAFWTEPIMSKETYFKVINEPNMTEAGRRAINASIMEQVKKKRGYEEGGNVQEPQLNEFMSDQEAVNMLEGQGEQEGQAQQDVLQDPQVQELLQAFAQASGTDINQLVQQIQQMSPEQQEQALQQIYEQLMQMQEQQTQQGNQPMQGSPMMKFGGTIKYDIW